MIVVGLTSLSGLSEVLRDTNHIPRPFTNSLLKDYKERTKGENQRLSDISVMYLLKQQNDSDGRYNHDGGFVRESQLLPPDEFVGLFATNQEYSGILEYTKSSARNKDPRAQFNIGIFLERGDYGPTNNLEALKWLRKAAEGGLADARVWLAECYLNGRGVPENPEEAVRFLREAAEQGDPEGQVMLGACYQRGCGITKNSAEALGWFRKAADQDNPIGQDELGKFYYAGEGLEKDDSLAAGWFRKAADQGYAEAQYHLGICYLLAQGVVKDYVEAYIWFNLATAQGHDKARQKLSHLESLMSKEQVAEGQRKSRVEEEKIKGKRIKHGLTSPSSPSSP